MPGAAANIWQVQLCLYMLTRKRTTNVGHGAIIGVSWHHIAEFPAQQLIWRKTEPLLVSVIDELVALLGIDKCNQRRVDVGDDAILLLAETQRRLITDPLNFRAGAACENLDDLKRVRHASYRLVMHDCN